MSIFHSAWLDTFWTDFIYMTYRYSYDQRYMLWEVRRMTDEVEEGVGLIDYGKVRTLVLPAPTSYLIL